MATSKRLRLQLQLSNAHNKVVDAAVKAVAVAVDVVPAAQAVAVLVVPAAQAAIATVVVVAKTRAKAMVFKTESFISRASLKSSKVVVASASALSLSSVMAKDVSVTASVKLAKFLMPSVRPRTKPRRTWSLSRTSRELFLTMLSVATVLAQSL